MPFSLPRRRALLALIASATTLPALAADPALLNVSYDVARELYKQLNPAFVAAQKAKGQAVTVNQSHGGSSKQIGAVIGGLEADVVTMNQATDVDQLASAGLTAADWRSRFPNGAAPYSSTMLFLVRKGNPTALMQRTCVSPSRRIGTPTRTWKSRTAPRPGATASKQYSPPPTKDSP